MISFIFLAYNDGQSLAEIIPKWDEVMRKLSGNDYELIISDDGSTDDTESIAYDMQKNNDKIVYIKSPGNTGVGANFKQAVNIARGDIIGYTDGDGQYDPADLEKMLLLLKQYDMVNGHRINRADKKIRSLTSWLYNRLVCSIYKINVRDINSGLKLYTRQYIMACAPQFSTGPFYDAEYLIKGYKKNLRITELPINHFPRKYGAQNGTSINSIKRLFKELCLKEMRQYCKSTLPAKLLFSVFSKDQ